MTQYLLSVHHSYSDAMPEPDEIAATYADVDAFNEKLQGSGAWVFGGGLEAPAHGDRRRINGGQASMTDGPYAESKEHMGGFWVIEAADLDAALAGPGRRRARARARSRCARSRASPMRRRREPSRRRDRARLPRGVGRAPPTLIRVLGDIDLAEEAVPEAFADRGRSSGRETGVPPNPGGWITTTARNRAIDRLRRESTRDDRATREAVDCMQPTDDAATTSVDAAPATTSCG